MPKFYRPLSSFVFAAKGEGNTMYSRENGGEPCLFADTDPAVKAHPELFEEYDVDSIVKAPATQVSAAPVEQTTSAPGEKRATRRDK